MGPLQAAAGSVTLVPTRDMHACACHNSVTSDIQVRAVPENLVDQAKRRADEEGLSLSAYIRGLLEHDSDQSRQRRQADVVLDRLARIPLQVSVSPAEVVVPAHFDVEVTSTLRTLLLADRIGAAHFEDAVEAHLDFPFTRVTFNEGDLRV